MSAQSYDKAEPNLVPMLDLVFQLITFFMLVINFKAALTDFKVKLPVLGSAAPIEWDASNSPLILNVDLDGQVFVYGKPVEVENFVATQARLTKDRLRDDERAAGGELPTPVVIRAHREIPFASLNRVIKVCQQNGYRKFSLSAMTRAEGG